MQKFIHTVDSDVKEKLEKKGYKLIFTRVEVDVTIWTFLDESGSFCFNKHKDIVKSKCLITRDFKAAF